jgi:MATE family multidrug resistance protein
VLAAVLMGIFAAIFVLFPEPLTALFTENPDVGASQICILLLPIAAVFQVMDGVQVVSLGALRGVADTKAPMIINLVGFWVIGIPAGYWFAFGLGGGPEGLWWGLTVGLTVVAVSLVARVWFKLRGELTRTEIDREDVLDPT